MTKYEYYMEMSQVARSIARYFDCSELKKFYKEGALAFEGKALSLTKEQACMLATEENLSIKKHYDEKLKRLKAKAKLKKEEEMKNANR